MKTKSRSLAGSWQEKQALCTASSEGLPSLKSANPQPPVAAYFFESLTMTCIFTGVPATKAWIWPKTLLSSSDGTRLQCSATMIAPSGKGSRLCSRTFVERGEVPACHDTLKNANFEEVDPLLLSRNLFPHRSPGLRSPSGAQNAVTVEACQPVE
jgi:hypothetical protein